tara:strand:- start:389 stop:826 length:438 start_codon:yes stop_codon:yes gene_type:complete
MAKNLILINGPNLNLLGSREPEIYGHSTLSKIENDLTKYSKSFGCELYCFQSNHEGEIIESIHKAKENKVDAIIINPAGLSHTSIALRDALVGVQIPFVEIHISNIFQRENFRQFSYLSAVASGVITGLGEEGYKYAVEFCIKKL